MILLTYDDWDFTEWGWKRVCATACGSDYKGSMDGGSEGFEVGVPQESSFLAGHVESIGEALTRSNGALSNVFGAIGPCAH